MNTPPTEHRESYHDSTAPLNVPARLQYGRNWTVGVLAQAIDETRVYGRGADVQRNTIEIWQQAFGRWVREAELDQAITDALAATVEELDAAIAELTAHRERLAAELARRPTPKVEPVQEGLPL